VGPNGAGKSTLLRILVGVVQRSQGRVSVLGLDPAAAALAIRRRCCYLPGETSVYQQMTGRRFLDFALGFYPSRHEDLLERLLADFELPLHLHVRSYSAGMKQKLALLATLVPDVEVYLLDEPDRALDASVRFRLRDILRELHGRGRTIVLSSHHLSEVENLADRMVFLVGGHTIPASLVERARLQLRRRIRLQVQPGTELPPGATLQHRDPDGTLVLAATGEPLEWLRALPPARVLSAEVGVVRLEELYQLLTQPPEAGA
jgi:ABC-2 type transport system ATP-binding protein